VDTIQERRFLFQQLSDIHGPGTESELSSAALDSWAAILASQKAWTRNFNKIPTSVLALQSFENRNRHKSQREPTSKKQRRGRSRSWSRSRNRGRRASRSRSHRRASRSSSPRRANRSRSHHRASRSRSRSRSSRQVKQGETPTLNSSQVVPQREGRCSVCKEATANVLILPCAHLCLCTACQPEYSRQFSGCPVCTETVTEVKKVFTT
jgi:hypothetical protein